MQGLTLGYPQDHEESDSGKLGAAGEPDEGETGAAEQVLQEAVQDLECQRKN